MKTKDELEEVIKDTITKYKEIIFGPDTLVCMACLEESPKQQVIDKKVYGQKLMDDTVRKIAWDGLQINIVMDGDTMIDGRTFEVSDPEVDSRYRGNQFKADFMAFVDHKITCRKAEGRHILNAQTPWLPEVFAIFRKKVFLALFPSLFK